MLETQFEHGNIARRKQKTPQDGRAWRRAASGGRGMVGDVSLWVRSTRNRAGGNANGRAWIAVGERPRQASTAQGAVRSKTGQGEASRRVLVGAMGAHSGVYLGRRLTEAIWEPRGHVLSDACALVGGDVTPTCTIPIVGGKSACMPQSAAERLV